MKQHRPTVLVVGATGRAPRTLNNYIQELAQS